MSEAEPFDWETDDLDVSWEFPALGWWSDADEALYEACEFGCDNGSVVYGDSLFMDCPACAGTGIGKRHSC